MSRSSLLSGVAMVAVLGASALNSSVAIRVAEAVPTARLTQTGPVKNSPAPVDQQRRTNAVRRLAGGYSASRGDSRRAGPGWSNKHAQRVAKKARNVKRSRRGAR